MPSRLRPLHAVLLALLAGGLALGGASGSTHKGSTEHGLGWRVEERPFRIVVTRDGRDLLAQAADEGRGPGRRMSYRLENGREHSLTRLVSARTTGRTTVYRVATDERGRTATVTVGRAARSVRVSLRLVPERKVAEVYEAFRGTRAEHFLGTGQRPGFVDLRGTVLPLKVWNRCRSTVAVPFFLSSRGYGVRLVTTAVGMVAFPEGTWDSRFICELGTDPCGQTAPLPSTRICLKSARLEYEVYAGTPARIVRAHAAATGRPSLPPPSQFALIKWRDAIASQDELFDDIEQLRSRRIPIGWILLDNPWEAGAFRNRCYGALRFDPQRFPDPKGMIDRIHALGVRFMLWVSPQAPNKRECPPAPFPAGYLVGDDETYVVDLTLPAARAEYRNRLDALVALGVDGFKGDRGDELDLEDQTLHAGSGLDQHNRIPVLFADAIAGALRKAHGRDYGTLNRAGYTGAQTRLHGMFGLDLPHDFNGLEDAVRMVQNAGVSGFPFWGSDIGGYDGSTEITSEVLIRWAQFGALTPIFQTGGDGLTSRFWELGEPTVALFRRAAVLHYELFPYLYELARVAARTGVPIVRPLGFRYPADEQAWSRDQQFLVGDDLLAAPVTSGSRQGNDLSGPPSRWQVYLPAGRWVDVFSRVALAGQRTITRPTPLSQLPLYLRAGAAIPFNAREPAVWPEPWRVNDLDRAGRAGWLVAPGPSRRSAAGRAGTLVTKRDGPTLHLRLEGGQRETQVIVLARARPCAVSVGGSQRSELRPEALRRAAAGWTFRRGALGGVVLKLTAPAREATVTFCA
jgi:alpha-glucosidase (family GH31 glycosyl hydrolase)